MVGQETEMAKHKPQGQSANDSRAVFRKENAKFRHSTEN
jgi:hypothetical protein